MNDFLPPKRPLSDIQRLQQPSASLSTPVEPSPVEHEMPLLEEPKPTKLLLGKYKKGRGKRVLWWSIGIIIVGIILAVAGSYVWYTSSLQPVSSTTVGKTRVQIVQGSSPADIGKLLETKGLIRSHVAFDFYTRFSHTQAQLQAGVYSLTASDSTQEIVTHLVSGNTDEFSITFLPGATITEDRAVLIKAGYSVADVDAALAKTYDHPLLADKPAGSDLEGYIYGETYSFDSDATVEQILTRTFDEFYKVVQDNNLIASFKDQGLSLYQGITLASIIQREVPDAKDQKQVAQVFFTRLKMGMQLGSDVTAYYGADKIGAERSVAVDTPYNTRIHTGLPPGPIGTPGLTALEAVAAPASGNYVFFLSGDDNVTYFATTDAEHEENIKNHCAVKCNIP